MFLRLSPLACRFIHTLNVILIVFTPHRACKHTTAQFFIVCAIKQGVCVSLCVSVYLALTGITLQSIETYASNVVGSFMMIMVLPIPCVIKTCRRYRGVSPCA